MRKLDKIITDTHARMMAGKRFSPKEITTYYNAVAQKERDDRLEISMLLIAEALHEEYGWGKQRISKVLHAFDDKCAEVVRENLSMDDLRLRCFAATKIAFALNEEDMEHVREILRDAGYDPEDL